MFLRNTGYMSDKKSIIKLTIFYIHICLVVVKMGCDYYHQNYIVVHYPKELSQDDINKIKMSFKHSYMEMTDIDYNSECVGNTKLLILMDEQPKYCFCLPPDPLLDDQNKDCYCIVNTKETLPSDKYSKLYSSLSTQDNVVTLIERKICTRPRW
jgi:hypothetical protein